MPAHRMSRRAILISLPAVAGLLAAAPAFAAGPVVHVAKDPNCGCCADWVEVLERAGFAVTVEDMTPDRLQDLKSAMGIPGDLRSCHTGLVEGYAIEGHVPAQDIRRLLADRPEAVGLSVPGMPYGAPGMGPEEAREAYDVILIRKDGSKEVYASYAAA